VCFIEQVGLREKDGAGGKRVASAPARQRTSWALKSLGKRVRFAGPFHPPGKGNQFIGDYKDFTGGLRTGIKVYGPVKVVQTYKASVKRGSGDSSYS